MHKVSNVIIGKNETAFYEKIENSTKSTKKSNTKSHQNTTTSTTFFDIYEKVVDTYGGFEEKKEFKQLVKEIKKKDKLDHDVIKPLISKVEEIFIDYCTCQNKVVFEEFDEISNLSLEFRIKNSIKNFENQNLVTDLKHIVEDVKNYSKQLRLFLEVLVKHEKLVGKEFLKKTFKKACHVRDSLIISKPSCSKLSLEQMAYQIDTFIKCLILKEENKNLLIQTKAFTNALPLFDLFEFENLGYPNQDEHIKTQLAPLHRASTEANLGSKRIKIAGQVET